MPRSAPRSRPGPCWRRTRTTTTCAAGRRCVRHGGSGVEPVDVEELAWGSVMGMAEAAAYYTVADALELAIVAGEFIPGGRGWRQSSSSGPPALLRSREHLDGASLLDRVLDERIDTWLDRHRGRRPRSCARCSPGCAARRRCPTPGPTHRAGALATRTRRRGAHANADAPAQAGDREGDDERIRLGRRLQPTQARGRLPGGSRDPRTGRSHRRGTRRKLQLSLTPIGKALLGDALSLWRRLCGALVSTHAYDAAVQELALALMLQEQVGSGARSRPRSPRSWTASTGAAATGWRPTNGTSAGRWSTSTGGSTMCLLQHDPDQPRWQDSWRPNQAGRRARRKRYGPERRGHVVTWEM